MFVSWIMVPLTWVNRCILTQFPGAHVVFEAEMKLAQHARTGLPLVMKRNEVGDSLNELI